jgi:hypothetical protein
VTTPKAGPESIPAEKGGPAAPSPNATALTGTSAAERLLAILQAQPEAPIDQLTQALYRSSDTAARNRLSTVLTQLKRRGKVQMVRRGKWRVVQPKRAVKASPSAKKAVVVGGKALKKPAPTSTKPEASTTPLSASDKVRALLLEHAKGLTTRQISDLLGPDNAVKHLSTVVTKMRIRGVLVATGERGSSVYKLSEGLSKGGK